MFSRVIVATHPEDHAVAVGVDPARSAGVVHEDVDTPVLGDDPVHRLVHLCPFADVGDHRCRGKTPACPDRVHRHLGGCLGDVEDDHRGTLFSEPQADRRTQAGPAAARDDGDLAVQAQQ